MLTRLLAAPDEILAAHRARLREQRDALAAAVSRELPEWRFHLPRGGLALWCQLPVPAATAVVADAEARGVIVAPGPVFAAEGGLDHFVRIPWTRPVDELETAVRRLAESWHAVWQGGRHPRSTRLTPRLTVA